MGGEALKVCFVDTNQISRTFCQPSPCILLFSSKYYEIYWTAVLLVEVSNVAIHIFVDNFDWTQSGQTLGRSPDRLPDAIRTQRV